VIQEILKRGGVTYARHVSFLTAAIFAVHPGISEAVQYLGAIGEPLFVLFCLLSLYKLLTGINYEIREIRTKNIVWSAVFGFLAYASKESAAAIFVIGLIYLYLFVKPERKSYLKYLAGAAFAILFYLFLRFVVAGIQYSYWPVVPIDKASLAERLLTIPKELITYLQIFFWPAKLQIYRNFVVHSLGSVDFWLPLSILIIVIAGIFLWLRKQQPAIKKLFLLFSIFYFLLQRSI
jgi:hypothetical protein